jgi:hypothetical protein
MLHYTDVGDGVNSDMTITAQGSLNMAASLFRSGLKT